MSQLISHILVANELKDNIVRTGKAIQKTII